MGRQARPFGEPRGSRSQSAQRRGRRSRNRTRHGIAYHTADVFDFHPEPTPDFVVSSQFTHHLADADVVRLLAWADRTARRGWFIADLHRHAFAYYGFPLLARIAGWHPIVRRDGQTSIARSFAARNGKLCWRVPACRH